MLTLVTRRQGRLNQISFHPSHPVIIVGDSTGQVGYVFLTINISKSPRHSLKVHSFKLSPNLRKQSRDVKIALANKDLARAGVLEIRKLEVLLALVRDPEKEDKQE